MPSLKTDRAGPLTIMLVDDLVSAARDKTPLNLYDRAACIRDLRMRRYSDSVIGSYIDIAMEQAREQLTDEERTAMAQQEVSG